MLLKYQDMKTQGFWTQAVLVDENGNALGYMFGTGGRRIFDPFTEFMWENYETNEEGTCATRRGAKKALRDSVRKSK